MRNWLLLILMLSTINIYAQHTDELIESYCSHGIECGDHTLAPTQDPNYASFNANCPVPTIEDYSLLAPLELFNTLIDSSDAHSCIYRTLVRFSTTYSPAIFSDVNVQTVAQLANGYFSTFDGINDNGSHGLMIYLGFAVQYSSDWSQHISYSNSTWQYVKSAMLTYANNPGAQSETTVGLYTTAHFLNAVARDSLNDQPVIVDFAGDMLDLIAADSYDQIDYVYPYYFCYYFLLDIYFRYAPLNQSFIDELTLHLDVITSLKDVAINQNLNSKTYVYFDDLSNFSITGLTNMIDYQEVKPPVLSALNEVSDTYDEYSPQWLTSAFALAEYDETYEYEVQDLTDGLRDLTLPNTFHFDEGKFIIETALDYEQALSLYEASQQVKAQFLRLLGDHNAVVNDQNDTVTAVVYGTRQDYVDYNGLLYGISYPNSGGVYIESYGTFFTYERLPTESIFSVEELFRHEYTHYLQGRYLIPGNWGVHQIYQDDRMVWFEEGMAQFLTGSTRTEGVKLINVIRDRISNLNGLQGLEDIFSSSYGSGNAHAYYDFSPLLWSYWYDQDRSLVDQMFEYVKSSEINSFDSLIASIELDTLHEQLYLEYINDIIDEDSLWITPTSEISSYDSMNSIELSQITNQIISINTNFNPSNSDIILDDSHSRFRISGIWGNNSPNSLEEELDHLLHQLGSGETNDPLNHAIGYYETKEQTEMGIPFFIEGPIGSYCPLPDSDPAMYVDSSYAILFHFTSFDEARNVRIREMGQTTWDYENATSLYYIDSLLNIVSDQGYEYQVRYQCNEHSWSQYSPSYTIYPCPSTRVIEGSLTDEASYYSSSSIDINAYLSGESTFELSAPQSVNLNPGFVIAQGSELLINNYNCTQGQFSN